VTRGAWKAAALLGALACGAPEPSPGPPLVVVSILPLAWFVDQLGGNAVATETLIPAGANPHSYEPSLAQIQAASRAVLWVKVGHPSFRFERTALEPVLTERSDLLVVDASGGTAEGNDPHIWLSPRRAHGIAARIADGLCRRWPGETASVRGRQAGLDARIDALDRELRNELAPFRGRAFFVFHPDWSAFAEDYGLRQVTLERGHKEPDVKALQATIDEARREGARAIFAQPQFSKESAELVAREVGARVVVIDALAYDWPATLRAMSRALAEALRR
jgi:zinc transport system substrate-binding protein